MPKSAKHLLIGSPEAYSGKSAIILGLAHQLQQKGLAIAYGKPLGTCLSESVTDRVDEDVRFIAQTLGLADHQLRPTLISLDEPTIAHHLSGEKTINSQSTVLDYLQPSKDDLVLLEGPSTLHEGRLFGLSIPQMAEALDAAVILVTRYRSGLVVDALLAAQQLLGDRLVGILMNDVPPEHYEYASIKIKTFLETYGIRVLGVLPHNDLLRSVSVGELVHQLNAEILCRSDRQDLMVESLKIGAMNVSAALKYFRKARHMAVVTGGDRTDIQLAALETSTHCLILTGQIAPIETVVSRAEELEVPILSVDLDTLTTVEIINRTFDQVRLHEQVKVQCIRYLMEKHCDINRLLTQLHLEPANV